MAKIAFIGLGNMGGPMAANLAKAQHHVTAFDLSDAAVEGRGREGRPQGGDGGRGGQGRRDRRHHAAGRQACARGLREGRAAQRRQGHAADRLLDHRRRQRPPCRGAGRRRRAWRWSTRRCRAASAAPRRARSPSWSAAAMAPSPRRRPILEKMGKNIVHAGASGNGPGGQDLQQHDPRHLDDRGQRGLHAGQAAGPRRAEAVRRGLDLVGPVLVADQLLPGAGPGADLAGQPRLPGGLHGGDDAEGPDAGPAGGERRRRQHAAGRRGGAALQPVRQQRQRAPRISPASSRCWTGSETR